MVALDASGDATARLNDIGVERALNQEPNRAIVCGSLGNQGCLGLFEGANELAADDFALGLWVGNALERI